MAPASSPPDPRFLVPCSWLPEQGGHSALPIGARLFAKDARGFYTDECYVHRSRYIHAGCAEDFALDLSEPELGDQGVPVRLDVLPWVRQILRDPECSREGAALRLTSPRDVCHRAAQEIREIVERLEGIRERVLAALPSPDGTQGLRLPTLERLTMEIGCQADVLDVIARDGGLP